MADFWFACLGFCLLLPVAVVLVFKAVTFGGRVGWLCAHVVAGRVNCKLPQTEVCCLTCLYTGEEFKEK